MSKPQTAQLLLPMLGDLMSRGDGTFVLKPRIVDSDLDTWITPKQAADLLGVKIRSVYTLFDESEPCLVTKRPLERKIVVSLKSLREYQRVTANPAFWTNSALRKTHIESVRAAIGVLCANPATSPQAPCAPVAKAQSAPKIV